MQSNSYRRKAFTLIELLLSLALVVVATALIGSLMQIYSHNFATHGDDIRREQLARALLNMIAEDIRSVVMEQEYDSSVLQQLLGGGGAGGGTGGGGGGGAATGGMLDSAASQPVDDVSMTDDLSTAVSTSIPPGIYGNQSSLMVDVSRIPRPDEYIVQQASIVDGFLTDVPGDMKTVTYFVQASTDQGVADPLSIFVDPTQNSGYSSGLVRRQLDRAVTAYAEETADTQRLLRTGDLVAPEVIAVEFAYFDGVDWLFSWDSSSQSLPWLIEITLAMQTVSASEQARLEPGTPISTMTYEDRQAYGIEVYQLTVAIPGAQLRAADAMTEDQAAGMESLGLF